MPSSEIRHPDTFVTLSLRERVELVLRQFRDDHDGTSPRSVAAARKDNFYVHVQPRPRVDRHAYAQAITEASDYLAREGLTTASSRQGGASVVLTEAGRAAKAAANPVRDVEARKLLILPLHDRLSPARTAFQSGDFEGAVFKAMRSVENAVRDASGITERLQPRVLMSWAFKADKGPLADPAQETAEQEGVMYLFMGAIGALRNPVGHREDLHEDPVEAAGIVIFADLLMDIVDRAVARGSSS